MATFCNVELPVHRRAERVLLLANAGPLRMLDALHIVLALDANAATVVTFDPRLARPPYVPPGATL